VIATAGWVVFIIIVAILVLAAIGLMTLIRRRRV
jgi:hypothetical protein